MEELVLVYPNDELWKLMTYKKKGLIRENSEVLKKIVQNGLFLKRGELEEDPSFKQIIPYAIISNKKSFYLFKYIFLFTSNIFNTKKSYTNEKN